MLRQIDLNRIMDFIKIVEFGSITRAANSINQPKTKLSRNLALLEKELGVQLIYRTTRSLQLTDAGQEFFSQAKVHLAGLETSVKEILGQEEEMKGVIRLTAPEDLGNEVLNSVISEFSQMHPRVQFELLYTNKVVDIVKTGIDVAYRMGHLKDSSLIQRKIGSVGFLLVASPKFIERNKTIGEPKDLSEVNTIHFSEFDKESWQLQSGSSKKSVRIKPHIVANNLITIRQLAISGMGVAFLPRFLVEGPLTSGELVQVLKPWGATGAPLQAVLPHQRNIAKRIRVFFDFSLKRIVDHI